MDPLAYVMFLYAFLFMLTCCFCFFSILHAWTQFALVQFVWVLHSEVTIVGKMESGVSLLTKVKIDHLKLNGN